MVRIRDRNYVPEHSGNGVRPVAQFTGILAIGSRALKWGAHIGHHRCGTLNQMYGRRSLTDLSSTVSIPLERAIGRTKGFRVRQQPEQFGRSDHTVATFKKFWGITKWHGGC
jgi:hypothetical protein